MLVTYPDRNNLSAYTAALNTTTSSGSNALVSAALHEQLYSVIPPQAAHDPRATSSITNSNHAAAMEAAGGPEHSTSSGTRHAATSIFMNSGAKEPLPTPANIGRDRANHKSHVIRLPENSLPPRNVAIPTTHFNIQKIYMEITCDIFGELPTMRGSAGGLCRGCDIFGESPTMRAQHPRGIRTPRSTPGSGRPGGRPDAQAR